MNMIQLRRTRRAFTLLEVLFAVVIIAVLAAIAVPMYINTRTDAAMKACSNNIRAIAAAESKAYFETGAFVATANNASLVGQGLGEVPVCPLDGSSYTEVISGGHVTIHCTNATHSSLDKQVGP